MTTHIVKQGECLSRIAAQYGFADWRRVYDAPQNAALRQKRPNPNVLYPGDEIFIPERQQKSVTISTGKAYRFTLKRIDVKLAVRMLDEDRAPLIDEIFTAEVDPGEYMFYGKTDGNGVVSLTLPIEAKAVRIWVAGHTRTLLLGELNPIENTPDGGLSGIQGRLHGLGFSPGPIDGIMGPRTCAALLAFQRQHKLPMTGKADDSTISQLKKEYGA